MSAEELGRRLASQVEETTLDHLLFSALRSKADPYSSFVTGIDPLDRLLSHSANLPWPPRAHDDNPRDATSIDQPPIIEITTPGPGNGRTSLLYLLAAVSVLPSIDDLVYGQNATIVVIDTNGRFDVRRLVQVMRQWITSRRMSASASATAAAASRPSATNHEPPSESRKTSDEHLIASALAHIHIFRPQSFDSLISTLSYLQPYLFDPSNASRKKRLAGVMITDTAAFQWMQKSQAEDARVLNQHGNLQGASAPVSAADSARGSESASLVSLIQSLNTSLSTPIIYSASTRIDLSSPSSSAWQQKRRIISIQRRSVRGFPPATSAIEALRDKSDRNACVARTGFDVSLLLSSSSRFAAGATTAAGPGPGPGPGPGAGGYAGHRSGITTGPGPDNGFRIGITADGVDLLDDEQCSNSANI